MTLVALIRAQLDRSVNQLADTVQYRSGTSGAFSPLGGAVLVPADATPATVGSDEYAEVIAQTATLVVSLAMPRLAVGGQVQDAHGQTWAIMATVVQVAAVQYALERVVTENAATPERGGAP